MFSARPTRTDVTGDDVVDPAEFQDYFVRHGRFTAGIATRYQPSLITGDPLYQDLAKGITVGMRFHSAPVIRMADAKPLHLGHVVRADGRWRLFAFADAKKPGDASSPLWTLCEFLERSPNSPVRQYTPVGSDIDSVIEVIAICQQPHGELSVELLPSMLLPRKGRYGLIDYEKVFCPDKKCGVDIFDLRGIDRVRGALVVVRPDQYIAHVLPLNAHEELAELFQRFMLRGS
jgi:hypothetical protein